MIFDRLEAHQEELAARNVSVRGEIPVETHARGAQEIISGYADYMLGYYPIMPRTSETFESTAVIVEVKNNDFTGGNPGIAQAVAYMAGIQQRRMRLEEPERIVDTMYGIISNGIAWWFLRLDGKRLQMSELLTTVSPADCRSIYQIIDGIIKSCISLSQGVKKGQEPPHRK